MLTELGIEARPVLASLQARQSPAVLLPTPEAFDHVIVQVRLAGRDLYLDPTRLGQAGLPAHMGQHLEDAAVLPVDAASRELVTIRSPNRAEIFSSDLSERFSLASFDAEGRLEVETRWSGVVAEKLRAAMQGMDADHVRSAVFGSYERRYPGIRLDGEPQVIDDRRLNLLTLRATFVVPRLAHRLNGDWVVPYLAGNLQGAFTLPEQPGRQFPLVVPLYPVTATYTVEITWPAGVDTTTSPVSHLLETPHFSLQSTRSLRGNIERRTVQLVPKVGEVPAAELPRLRQDLRQLDFQIRSVLMAAAGDIKDSGAPGGTRNTVLDTLRGGLTAQIERADRLLAGGQLVGEDLAMALCSRAAARVDLGAPVEGLNDALAAVREAELSGYAWLCLGNVQFALGEFAKANAAFTRALPLVDAPEGVTFRRGHARFYAGRLDEAAVDFARTAATATDDASRLYALLWQATTLQRLGKPLPSDLVATAAQEPRGAWPRPALALLAGLLSVDDVLTELQLGRGDLRDFGLVEGWFYIGQHHLARARPAQAREAFEKVREKGVTMYVEHIAAGFELRRLGARP
jgi:lipoprotein NlpI